MHAIISIAVTAGLAIGASAEAGSAIANSAHYTQADQVSIIKVEGMT